MNTILADGRFGFILWWILFSCRMNIARSDGSTVEFSYTNYMKFLDIDPKYVDNKYLPQFIKIKLYRKHVAGGRGTQLFLDRPDTWTNFDSDLATHFIVHGFVAGAETSQVTRIRDAYLLSYDNNVITVDWSPFTGTDIESSDQYILAIAFMNDLVAPFLQRYIEYITGPNLNTSPSKIHLVGHSLGAHLMGIVSKKVKVDWVTGLDPAAPGYSKEQTETRLTPQDAAFVEVIHTNIGEFGEEWSCGTVDYYINNGGPVQPHSHPSDKQANHAYSYIVYSNAIEESVIEGIKCPSEEVAMQGKCKESTKARIGDRNATPGIYSVKTTVPW
uniref:Phospholipase A1 member A n=1 Tax=Cacopsylla melanoneura TaxID=428564 RepID=A0A8D8LU39_9HEMI